MKGKQRAVDKTAAMVHMIALLAAALLGQPAPEVTGVAAARSGAATIVTIGMTVGGRVSEPKLLEEPWRIYFDIEGLRPGERRLLEVGGGPVSRVRLALNQPSPPVTRVVIDLSDKAPWRVERAPDGSHVRIIVGDEAGGAAVPPQGDVIYAPPPAPAPAVDRRAQIRTKLFNMTPALDLMRTWTGPSDEELAALIGDAETLATGARAMTIAGSAADLALVSAIDAVAAAAHARARALADGTPQSRANAISAASGALLLLEHARAIDSGNVNGKR